MMKKRMLSKRHLKICLKHYWTHQVYYPEFLLFYILYISTFIADTSAPYSSPPTQTVSGLLSADNLVPGSISSIPQNTQITGPAPSVADALSQAFSQNGNVYNQRCSQY